MARGNQRDKAREKNQKEQASKVRVISNMSRLPGSDTGPEIEEHHVRH